MAYIIAIIGSTGIIITLQSASIFLGIIISLSVIAGMFIRLITQFNNLTNAIKDLEKDLLRHATSREKIDIRLSQIEAIDRKIDLHIQDYIVRKESVQMHFAQINEKIESRTNQLENSIKRVESFLQREGNYKKRYEE